MEKPTINCPKCDEPIDVNELIYNEMRIQLTNEFNTRLLQDKQLLDQKNETLDKERAELLKLRTEINTAIEIGAGKRISQERAKLEKVLRQQIQEEKQQELNSYKEQLAERIKDSRNLNKLRADYQKLEREKIEMKEKLEAESEERITRLISEERKFIKKKAEEKSELIIAEKEHIIDQLRAQIAEAGRKAEQGSSQLRGEVMETEFEDYLRQNFPADKVEEVKKGTKGADCLHIVNDIFQKPCGSIYYEIKRTKVFQPSWLSKFKTDLRDRNANIGVLVTETYPKGVERITMIDGIWICSFEEAKGLCSVLRESLILLHDAKAAQSGKSGKMEILYNYMVSNEFRMQIEAIVEAFTTMQKSLMHEKRAMEAIWKQRQKELANVIINTTHIYSSIRAIAGNSVKPIKQLELTQQIDK